MRSCTSIRHKANGTYSDTTPSKLAVDGRTITQKTKALEAVHGKHSKKFPHLKAFPDHPVKLQPALFQYAYSDGQPVEPSDAELAAVPHTSSRGAHKGIPATAIVPKQRAPTSAQGFDQDGLFARMAMLYMQDQLMKKGGRSSSSEDEIPLQIFGQGARSAR